MTFLAVASYPLSRRERVRVRGFRPHTTGTLRRHCVGAGSAATFTPALSRWERELKALHTMTLPAKLAG